MQCKLLCPNGPYSLYHFEPLQQSRQQVIRAYCSNIYTVLNLTDLRIKMDSKRIPLYPFFKIVVSILSEIEKKEKICGHFPFPPFKIRLDQGSSEMSRLSSIWGWVCENRLWSCKFSEIVTLWYFFLNLPVVLMFNSVISKQVCVFSNFCGLFRKP